MHDFFIYLIFYICEVNLFRFVYKMMSQCYALNVSLNDVLTIIKFGSDEEIVDWVNN